MENSVIWNNCLLDQILKLFMYSLDFNPMMLCVHKIDKHMQTKPVAKVRMTKAVLHKK